MHAIPESLLRQAAERETDGVSAARADGGWLVTLPGARPALVRPLMTDRERRRQAAASRGVSAQVLSPWLDVQLSPGMSQAQARSWARRLNAALAESEGGAVLATVAVTGHAAADLSEAVDDGTAAGLILSTSPAGADDLADPVLEPLWESAEGLGVPVVLHPPADGPSAAIAGSAEFGNALGRLVDTTFAVSRLILSGVLDRHPGLRLVTVHGGGFLPYQSMRVDGAHRADALRRYAISRDRPSDYLGDLYYDTVALKPAAIRLLAETAGPARVLLGSDYPFALGDPAPAETVRAAGLSPASTAAVLGGNAARLFTTTLRR
ncbi:MAG TPA: amidohydrolase family protein [Trebonia sp.]|nr:amidohydrolase family protein [Trebonia sp.]